MHTLSSAKRTCMASASAVECTATVGMPSSWQARSTRSAISPRLAMRILSNIVRGWPRLSLDDDERLADHDLAAEVDERRGAGRGAPIGGADHRRVDGAGMLGRVGRRYGGRSSGWRCGGGRAVR